MCHKVYVQVEWIGSIAERAHSMSVNFSFACLVLAGTPGRQGRQVVRLGSLGVHQGDPCPCPVVGGPQGTEDPGGACFHLQRQL